MDISKEDDANTGKATLDEFGNMVNKCSSFREEVFRVVEVDNEVFKKVFMGI